MKNNNINDGSIPLAELIDTATQQYEYVAEVYASHLPTVDDVSELVISLHTDGTNASEEFLDVVPQASTVSVEIGNSDTIQVPYSIMATCLGTVHPPDSEGTILYMADDVKGAAPKSLDNGLSELRKKLNGVCPTCDRAVPNLSSHLRGPMTCLDSCPQDAEGAE